MVLDTSILIAILRREPEAALFARLIEEADVCYLSSVSLLDVGIIVDAERGAAGARTLDEFLQDNAISVDIFDEEQANVARQAYTTYGRGRHPARLNFGDCASYALAKTRGEPLL